MKFLTSGKVKDLYEKDENSILFKFSDRVSAYDVKFSQDIPKKGQVLCHFAEFWFNKLDVSNHFIKRESETEISVKKMTNHKYFCSLLVGKNQEENFLKKMKTKRLIR